MRRSNSCFRSLRYPRACVMIIMRYCCTTRVFKFIKQWKDTLVVRFKILVTHFQIVTTFPVVLDVQWPEAFNRCVFFFFFAALRFFFFFLQYLEAVILCVLVCVHVYYYIVASTDRDASLKDVSPNAAKYGKRFKRP